MEEQNWLSLGLLVVGLTLIAIEVVAFTFKLLVIGIAALCMALACYLFPIPIWALVAFGIAAALLQIKLAKNYPGVKGVPAGEVVGQQGYISGVSVRDGITHAVISFSKPYGGREQWDVKQTESLMNQSRARVLKINDDSTLSVEIEGESEK